MRCLLVMQLEFKQIGEVGFGNSEFGADIWAKDIKLIVISILMTFKAIGADESPRE